MRGPLFETWVVSEVSKFLRNRGRAEEVYSWRDTHGHEVDLILDQALRAAQEVPRNPGREQDLSAGTSTR